MPDNVTDIHSEYVILMLLHCNNGRTNAAHCNVKRTQPVITTGYRINVDLLNPSGFFTYHQI